MSPQSPIELSGTLTRGDLIGFRYFHSCRRGWVIGIVVAVLLAAFVVNLSRSAYHDALFLLLLLLWLIGLPWWDARRQWATRKSLAQPLRAVFTPEVIRSSAPGGYAENPWTAIREIYETRSMFLLYLAPRQAIIAPKRFFPDDRAIEAWKRLARSQVSPRRFKENTLIGRCC